MKDYTIQNKRHGNAMPMIFGQKQMVVLLNGQEKI